MQIKNEEVTIDKKINKAREILKEAEAFNTSTGVLFTGSKETTVILDLIRGMNSSRVPFPVVHIDTGLETAELYEYRERIQKEWNLDMSIITRQGLLSVGDIAKDKKKCCKKLKEEGLQEALKQYGWKALIFDSREVGYEGITVSGVSIINPVAHFDELDFWRYITQKHLPYCSLYNKGFKLIACEPCLRPWLKKGGPPEEHREEIEKRLRSLGYI
jgi:phosphoadenosine phosphosulfate reductase